MTKPWTVAEKYIVSGVNVGSRWRSNLGAYSHAPSCTFSSGVERALDKREVRGSKPRRSTIIGAFGLRLRPFDLQLGAVDMLTTAKRARLAAACRSAGLVARLAEQQIFNLLGAGSNLLAAFCSFYCAIWGLPWPAINTAVPRATSRESSSVAS